MCVTAYRTVLVELMKSTVDPVRHSMLPEMTGMMF